MLDRSVIDEITTKTVDRVLRELNVTPEIITISSIKRLYGREIARRARESAKIEWFPLSPKGGGYSVYCKRSQFIDFLFDKTVFQQ